MADARDSKSRPVHPGCGSESHLRHRFLGEKEDINEELGYFDSAERNSIQDRQITRGCLSYLRLGSATAATIYRPFVQSGKRTRSVVRGSRAVLALDMQPRTTMGAYVYKRQ